MKITVKQKNTRPVNQVPFGSLFTHEGESYIRLVADQVTLAVAAGLTPVACVNTGKCKWLADLTEVTLHVDQAPPMVRLGDLDPGSLFATGDGGKYWMVLARCVGDKPDYVRAVRLAVGRTSYLSSDRQVRPFDNATLTLE